MSEVKWEEIFETAKNWTREAGEFIKEKMSESFDVSTKANENDLVTDVDKGVEEFFKSKISTHYTNHRLLGEEGSYKAIKDLSGVVWIIDPIDGTVNFVHQQTFFAISVGVYIEGEGMIGIIYDVMNGEMFSALKGEGAFLNGTKLDKLKEVPLQESILSFNAGWILKDRRLEELVKACRATRSYGSAALDIAYVASGRLDGYISFILAPWDIAAGMVILKEVGGVASRYNGDALDFLESGTFMAATPSIYNEFLELVKK
ncbi:inositol monophosphatase family protein [Evansella cellulosilytica]|uniref:inositol-phosphate phosphatase n=1 Tax=Evansella cellulosilytica (strain ATCC 21833 / DSM 2522 / FERM P-1141 / JCM 9156 / N-4) TaxID=649639 RepID=E6TUL9_EVAC2|nr:inositol monophosphatase family protein [Evansella cellulosilytica]ADU30909.1 inositol monophosphatase [Evansella cellulosilytica DSM 2522]